MFGHRQAGQVAELSAQGRLARAATTEYQHPSHARTHGGRRGSSYSTPSRRPELILLTDLLTAAMDNPG